MKLASTFQEARSFRSGLVGLVPTMGFLHEGHMSLIEAAREACDTVIVTLYLNPLQFNDDADLDRYPRDLDRDRDLAAGAGADMVFAPPAELMFGVPPQTEVSVSNLSSTMEGLHRPGHFAGVATVVAKLFGGLQPDRAYFGRKDAQQLAVVRRMTADLSFPVDIVGRPIIREFDGLALSSRNVFIDPAQRPATVALGRGLMIAADLAEAGERRAGILEGVVLASMAETEGVDAEYVALAATADVAPLAMLDQPGFLALAARVGDVRLIDNVHFDVDSGGVCADRGIRLEGPSILYGNA